MENAYWIALIVQAIIFGALCASLWHQKGGSELGGFFLGFFLSWLGLIYVIASKPSVRDPRIPTSEEWPYFYLPAKKPGAIAVKPEVVDRLARTPFTLLSDGEFTLATSPHPPEWIQIPGDHTIWRGYALEPKKVIPTAIVDKEIRLPGLMIRKIELAYYERTQAAQAPPTQGALPQCPPLDTTYAREIRELAALLRDGLITQEEFDAKKQKLLGL